MLSLFYDVLYIIRLLSIPTYCRYTVPKIKVLQASRTSKKTKGKLWIYRISLFFWDILFCLVCAVTLILLLYWLNNGAFRAAAPLCMTLGFGVWHISISKPIRIALQWLLFGIETAIHTLLMPIKRLAKFISKGCSNALKRRRYKHSKKQRQIYTQKELKQIDKAVRKLLPQYSTKKQRMQKGVTRAKPSSKKAV